MFVGTWWSLMPPIIAILLALLTKEVYLSLFAGCALGALLVAEFHPWVAFDTLFNTMINSVDFSILMFMILLGMVVMLMRNQASANLAHLPIKSFFHFSHVNSCFNDESFFLCFQQIAVSR